MADSQIVFDLMPQGGDAPEREPEATGFGGLSRTGAADGFSHDAPVFSFGSPAAPAPELNLTGSLPCASSGTADLFDLDAGLLPKSAQTGGGASHTEEFSAGYDFQEPEQPQLQVGKGPLPAMGCFASPCSTLLTPVVD